MTEQPRHLEDRESDGEREYSPSAERNTPPLLEQLSQRWPAAARVLEIASGTGQHAVAFCKARSDITWQTSDPYAPSRASQDAWAIEAAGQIKPSLDLDVTREAWWAELGRFDAMFCANMIHISPSTTVTGLADGASGCLTESGEFYLYGPFLEGAETAESNQKFDENLKQRNSDWGVRNLSDVKHIFATRGLKLSERIIMPKENRLLVFKRSP
ncbi:MAG: DUF938 domain-containing protein [Maricaulaceae bacterium]